jgi:hypothetical protein
VPGTGASDDGIFHLLVFQQFDSQIASGRPAAGGVWRSLAETMAGCLRAVSGAAGVLLAERVQGRVS